MILDDDKYIEEHIFDNKPISFDLLMDNFGYVLRHPQGLALAVISPDHKFCVERRYLSKRSTSDLFELKECFFVYKSGAKRYTEKMVQTIGDLKEYIKRHTYKL